MRTMRNIIEINEELCNGCGQCVIDCAEGALQIVDGKAKLIGEILCDGLGACLGGCPTGALKVIQREAEEFDEHEVERHLAAQGVAQDEPPTLACGCPSNQTMTLDTIDQPCGCQSEEVPSQLGHWPIKLQLLSPNAPYLAGSDLLLLSDCGGASMPDLHQRLLAGRTVALACPKLDDAQTHIDKLAQLIQGAGLRSITTVMMEVPCCRGLDFIARRAMEQAGVELPLGSMVISRTGKVLENNPPETQAA